MGAYVIRRLLYVVFVGFAALTIVFVLVRLSGDPALLIAGPDATPEQIQSIRENLGLDKPIYAQYGQYIWNSLNGDFGKSLRYGSSALTIVLERVPATLELTGVGLALTIVLAVPAGILAATYRNTWVDHVISVTSLWGQTVPVFWLGIVLILFFSVKLGWFPTSGRGGIGHLILPAITIAAFQMARITQLVRSEMLEVLAQEHIRVARSKGLTEQTVVMRHALRNAAIPVVTIIGLQVGQLMGGAVITETVFSWPGVGRLMVQSIMFRDFTVTEVAVLALAMVVAFINLLVDLSYAWLDPRIRYT